MQNNRPLSNGIHTEFAVTYFAYGGPYHHDAPCNTVITSSAVIIAFVGALPLIFILYIICYALYIICYVLYINNTSSTVVSSTGAGITPAT